MAGEFYNPNADTIHPDILASYVRGQMAPLQVQQAQQGVTAGGLDIDKLKLALQGQQMTQNLAQQLASGGQANGAQNAGAPTGGMQNGPQGQVGGTDTASPSPFGGGQVNTMMALDILQGRDPLKTAQSAQEYEQKQRQLQAQGPLSLLDTVAGSASPARIVMNNPSLMQRWQATAPIMGLDPVKDFSDENVRAAVNFARNKIAGSAGLPTVAPPVQEKTINGPLGSVYQQNPLSQKITQVKGEEPLKDVIDPATGQPTNVRASQAEGKQPFQASVFGASNVSDQALQFAADTYRTTGKFPAAFGRSPIMQGKILDKVAADAQASGDTTGAITARAAALKANGQALDQVTKLESATTSYYNTLDKNLNNLTELAGKVDSSGVPLINKVYRAWQQGVSGDPDVAKYVTYLNSVEGEFAKIQSGSLGNAPVSDASKKDAKDVINKYMATGQISAVAEAMRGEGNNRLSSIRDQKQQLLGSVGQNAPGSQGAQNQPSQAAPQANLPSRNQQGWVLHTDAKGNKAYVSPDGKQYQEVK